MWPKSDMVPKECGFYQSETACGICSCIAWRFPCLHATARDGELIRNTPFLPSCLLLVRHFAAWIWSNNSPVLPPDGGYAEVLVRHSLAKVSWVRIGCSTGQNNPIISSTYQGHHMKVIEPHRHNSPSELNLPNNQAMQIVYMTVDATIIRSFQKEIFSHFHRRRMPDTLACQRPSLGANAER